MNGLSTLFYKEVLRFWRVSLQTILGPVLSSLLYLLIFSHALGSHVQVYTGVSYLQFLVPGLVMMTMLQNAFANPSSSLIQSKITGNIVFILLPPLSYLTIFIAYVGAAIVRGIVVGLGVLIAALFFTHSLPVHLLWVLVFTLLCCWLMGVVGLIAGIWAEKFDQLAGFQNFLITPLTFLSGVFYSIHSLPAFWQTVSHFNPFFYMIDGFRYGFLGHSDVAISTSFSIVMAFTLVLSVFCLQLLRKGYKLRH